MTDKQSPELQALQKRLGIRFADPSLLKQALTHRSYVNEHTEADLIDNERLEFLGDSVLSFITADMLFRRFPAVPEGDLTRLRAALVRTESLAEFARTCQVGETLRMGKGEEASGGRARLNNLCGAFEAVIGAIYLDKGLDAVRDFIMPLFDPLLDQVIAESLDKDARSLLQEWSQQHHSLTPVYTIVGSTGPEHQKEFTVNVLVGGQVLGTGTGRSKQAASQSAARAALDAIRRGDVQITRTIEDGG